jgi:Lipocalin-like domain
MPDTWPQKLVGTWTLVSWEQKKADGSKVRRYGENPVGIAFFDAGGRYIISVMRSDRANTRAPLRGKVLPRKTRRPCSRPSGNLQTGSFPCPFGREIEGNGERRVIRHFFEAGLMVIGTIPYIIEQTGTREGVVEAKAFLRLRA